MNSQLNNEKVCLFEAKITKSSVTFRKNKPNSPIVQMNVTFFITMNYTILASLTKVKNKPNQTQFKANSNPITEKPKMNTSSIITMNYKIFPRLPGEKQTQFKPKTNLSSYVAFGDPILPKGKKMMQSVALETKIESVINGLVLQEIKSD